MIVVVTFIIQFIYLHKQKQEMKKTDTHFSFRLIYYSVKHKFCTNRLNDGFRLNARILT